MNKLKKLRRKIRRAWVRSAILEDLYFSRMEAEYEGFAFDPFEWAWRSVGAYLKWEVMHCICLLRNHDMRGDGFADGDSGREWYWCERCGEDLGEHIYY